MSRARITMSVDKAARIIFVRYIGELDGPDVTDSIITQSAEIEHMWEYDGVFDMRRFDGVVPSSELENFGQRWAALTQGRDAGRRTAVITDDAFIHARFSSTQEIFSGRILKAFHNFDEGLDWINSQREADKAALAG